MKEIKTFFKGVNQETLEALKRIQEKRDSIEFENLKELYSYLEI